VIRVEIGRTAEAEFRVRPTQGLVEGAAERAGFIGQAGQTCQLEQTLLVALGDDAEQAGALAVARLPPVTRVAVDVAGLPAAQGAAFAAGMCQRAWRMTRLRTRDVDPGLERLDLVTDHPGPLRRAWAPLEAALTGAWFARDLVVEPSNYLTPQGFIARLDTLTDAGVTLQVLEGAALRQAGLGGLLAVGGGSAHPPALVVLRWAGTIEAPPMVFIGKGITFDTGGICIKPAAGMEEMRADMAGAAACAGAMLALALRGSPAPVAAVLALAENATSEASYRPSDVLRMADGSTVEIVDTDAEGRLVLADALAWAVRHLQPAAIVDLATLTGSIVTALGGEMAGLFDNDPAFAAHVAAAGASVGEPVWRMPIGARHLADLDSLVADQRQCVPGRGQPDACHAAAFLSRFAGAGPWAHLDIAGMEARATAGDRHAAGPTGFGVRLLDRLVSQYCEDPHR
jgi:leucyl aminopeptidase